MKRIDQLIRQKAKCAAKMNRIREKLDPLIEERYGIHPSEIDCDSAIDALDYGLSEDYTLKNLDWDMTQCKHPPKNL